MNVTEFLITNMESEKDGYISMIRNNDLSDDERKVLNQKIDNLDERIAAAKNLESDKALDVEKKLNEMNAKFDAVKEKLSQRGVKIEGLTTTDDYLKSQNAVDDFADCLKNCSDNTKFSSLWAMKLKQNDINFDDATELALMPAPVATYINDAWEREAGAILRDFNFVGAYKLPVVLNPTDQDSDESRAKGHTKGSRKVEQSLALTSFTIDTQFVYKIQSVYKKMEFTDNGALIRYVVDELMTQWFYEVLRAVLVGDGRDASSQEHISSIIPIDNNTMAQAADAMTADETVLEYIMDKVVAPIEDGSRDIILFINKADFQVMRKYSNGNGATPTYMSEEQLTQALGLKRIVVVPYFSNTNPDKVRAIAVHANRYTLIGSLNPDFLSWEEPWENTRNYRIEMLVGGNITGMNAASYAHNA